jgi:hypothetical protein
LKPINGCPRTHANIQRNSSNSGKRPAAIAVRFSTPGGNRHETFFYFCGRDDLVVFGAACTGSFFYCYARARASNAMGCPENGCATSGRKADRSAVVKRRGTADTARRAEDAARTSGFKDS